MERFLRPIEVKLHEGHVVVPTGMTLVYLHDEGNRRLAYVEHWTASGEYDATDFDLYNLSTARRFTVCLTQEGEAETQTWYGDFGKYTKEAHKGPDGFICRERQS